MPVARHLAVSCLLAASTLAQHPLFVRVVDGDGMPLAGAEVHVFDDDSGLPTMGADEHRVLTTDARGHCRVDVHFGQGVLAFALGPIGAAGDRAVTDAAELRHVGTPAELRVSHRAPAVVEHEIEGLEAWRELGPFRARVRPIQRAPVGIELPIEGGRVRVPPLPDAFFACEVLTADGATLWAFGPRARRLAVPPPREIPITVRDERGAGVPGVEILHQSGDRTIAGAARGRPTRSLPRWRLLARTDADGNAVALVPCDGDPLQEAGEVVLLWASKRGFAPCFGGNRDGPFVGSTSLPAGRRAERLEFVLQPAPDRECRLPADLIAAGARVRATSTCTVLIDDRRTLRVDRVLDLEVRDALVPLPAAGPEEELRLEFPLRWHDGGGRPLHIAPVALGPLDENPLAPFGHRGLRVHLRVRDLAGRPLPAATIRLGLAPGFDLAHAAFSADALGEADLFVPERGALLAVLSGEGFAHAVVPSAVQRAGVAADLDLQLQPYATFTGELVDAAGAPVPRGRARYTPAERVVDAQDEAVRALQAVAIAAWEQAGEAIADDQGRIRLQFVECPAMPFLGTATAGRRRSEPFALEPAATPPRIVLR